MKKQLFLTLILIFTVALLIAGTPRVYTQKVQLDNGTIDTPYVTNTGNTNSPNYVITATLVELNESYSSTTLGPTQIRISRLGNGTTTPYYTAVFFQMSNFSIWSAGQTLRIKVEYIGTQEPEDTGTFTTWDLTIPAGTTVWNPAELQTIPPTQFGGDTWTYNLAVTGPMGYTVTGPGTYAGDINNTYTCNTEINDLLGNWTAGPAPIGFHWVVNPIAVTADMFVGAKVDHVYNAAINFELAADPDTYTYHLQVNGPAGKHVTGPVSGDMPYLAEDLDGTMENALLGVYTAEPAPAGWEWVVNPIIVTADMFVAGKSAANLKAIQGSRTNGAKVAHVYNATILFELQEIVIPDTYTYQINVNGPAGYAVTGPANGTTPYFAVDGPTLENVNDLLGDYTIAAAPAGFHWAVNPITVTADMFTAMKTNYVYGATITFELVENVVVIIPGNPLPDGVTYDGTTYTINQSGLYTVTIPMPAGFSIPWYIQVNTVPPTIFECLVDPYTFPWDFGAKAPFEFLPLDEDPTLPVELSSFTAALTAQNFVKLTWVSQSETGLLGYRVYRNENNVQANAVNITPVMVPATNTSTTQTYSIVDNEVSIGSTYYYWLESVDMGHSTFHGPVSVLVEGEVPPVLPEYTTMRNAYPNPFRANSNTTIEVSVKAGETGTVTIYNILGQVVKTFSVKEGLNPLSWNGRDAKGNACGSGIYFYKLSTPSMNQTKKMVIVK